MSSTDTVKGPERPVPDRYLTDRIIEQVLTKGCSAGSLPGPYTPDTELMDVDAPSTSLEEVDELAMTARMRDRYSSSTMQNRSFRVPHSSSPRDGQGTLVVPGWVLERVAEILFDSDVCGADEGDTIPQAILNTLLKVSVIVVYSD